MPADAEPSYVSTGELPLLPLVEALVNQAHERFRGNTEGHNSTAYPALEAVPSSLYGLALTDVTGNSVTAGDAEVPFTVMSVSKPFVFALMCQRFGADVVRERIGVNATGLPFDSVQAVEQSVDGRTNPMVNSGAIATSSLAPGETVEQRWQFLLDGMSAFVGHPLTIDEELHDAAIETNHRNRTIAAVLDTRQRLYCDPVEAVELYTRQCCLAVTAADLAVMGATLADGGSTRSPASA